MYYITVAEYMQFAGMSTIDSNTSTAVSLLISATTGIIDSIIGDLSYSQKSEDIRVCDIEEDCCLGRPAIQFDNVNIASIDEINGLSYTGVLNTDYQIVRPRNSKVVFKSLSPYISGLQWAFFNVKYTSGYSTIPDDVKYLQYLLVSGELAKENGQEVKSYSLGPRSVSFKDENTFQSANTILLKYSVPVL